MIDIRTELARYEEYERVEWQGVFLNLYIAFLLGKPSGLWHASRWLRYLPLRIWHRVSDPFLYRDEWLRFREKTRDRDCGAERREVE